MYTMVTGLIRVGYFRARRSSRGCLRSYRRSRRIYLIFYHIAIECCDWLERSGEGGRFSCNTLPEDWASVCWYGSCMFI